MEGDPTANPGSTAVAEPSTDAAQPSAQTAAGVSGDWLDKGPSEETTAFRDFLTSGRESDSLTSKPAANAGDGESAPRGDETPASSERGADGRFIPRRGIPKAVADAEAKVTQLQQQLADRDPEKLRQQWESEQQQQSDNAKLDEMGAARSADVARYRQSIEMLDTDPGLNDLVPGDPDGRTLYQWREDFKERLRAIPEVEANHRELARQTIEAETQRLSARETKFLNGQYEQVARLAAEIDIDPEAWKVKGTTFESMARDYGNAREAAVRAELGERIRELEGQVRQFGISGQRGLGAARSGLNGGAPGGPVLPTSENDIFRQWLGSERSE